MNLHPIKAILLMLALCLPATAQSKVWTWTNPVPDSDLEVPTGVHAAVAHASGAAATILGEAFVNNHDVEVYRYRLIWLSPRGSVIHQVMIPATVDDIDTLLNLTDSPWRVLAVDRGAWVVTNGKKIWSAKLNGRTVEARERDVPADTDLFPAGAIGSSQGWFERKTKQLGTYVTQAGIEVPVLTLGELSLWSAR
jgi:hypothetical protein